MSYKDKVQMLLREPEKIITSLAIRGGFNWLSDKLYLKLVFRSRLKRHLDINHPLTFNEKLQWLKLYYRKPEQVIQVDKVAVRNYIQAKIGAEYLVPMIGVYDKAEDIPWGNMPSSFVLKCSHASSANIICKDISEINTNEIIKKLSRWMKRNWYWYGREWPYKNVPHRIIAEQYLVDESGKELKDYKINCFHGEPKFIQVMSGRRGRSYYLDHFDLDWNHIKLPRKNHVESKTAIPKPPNLPRMLDIARELSEGIPFVRVDLYNIGGKIYFGEVTFYPVSGFVDFADEQTDMALGQLISLEGIQRDA